MLYEFLLNNDKCFYFVGPGLLILFIYFEIIVDSQEVESNVHQGPCSLPWPPPKVTSYTMVGHYQKQYIDISTVHRAYLDFITYTWAHA